MQAELDPSGAPVIVDDVTVRTFGISGSVETLQPRTRSRTRGAAAVSTELDRALARSSMRPTHQVAVDVSAQVVRRGRATRAAGAPSQAIVLDVPAPVAGYEQVAVSIDAATGVINWHFAEGTTTGASVTRGSGEGTRRYTIPHTVAMNTAVGTETSRGIGGVIGARIVKIIAFKVGKYVGEKARDLVRDWELKNCPNGVRAFDVANHAQQTPYFVAGDPRWGELAKGRALLFIHGTFSRTQQGFGELDEKVLESLQKTYGNRVFAFDNPTVSVDPEQNARWFIEQIPDGSKLELDIICHSRGGLVARTLAERSGELGGAGKLSVKRVVLVAAPNEGTILADVEHWNKLIDTVSSLFSLAGGPGISDVLETVLALIRQIVVSGYQELAGLACMVPTSGFLDALNGGKRHGLKYLGIGSNFEPKTGGFAALIRDEALDALHGGPNDVLVRTDSAVGAAAIGGTRFAPPDEVIVLEGVDGVEHSGYFENAPLMGKVRDWLAKGLPA